MLGYLKSEESDLTDVWTIKTSFVKRVTPTVLSFHKKYIQAKYKVFIIKNICINIYSKYLNYIL